MTLIIFYIFLLLLVGGLILLVFKTVKDTTTRVIVTVIFVIIGLILAIVGGLVWGTIQAGRAIVNEAQKTIEENDKNLSGLKPQLTETGEIKDIFKVGEQITGNNLEFSLDKVERSREGIFADKSGDYCNLFFTLKNNWGENIILLQSDFVVRNSLGEQQFSLTGTVPENQGILTTSVEMSPGKTESRYIPFDCKQGEEPFTLTVNTGSIQVGLQSIFSEEKFTPIVVEFE